MTCMQCLCHQVKAACLSCIHKGQCCHSNKDNQLINSDTAVLKLGLTIDGSARSDVHIMNQLIVCQPKIALSMKYNNPVVNYHSVT